MRLTLLSAGYGFLAGIVAAFVLWLMELLAHFIWSGPETRWYIFTMIMVGGMILAVLRHWYAGSGLNEQIAGARMLESQKRRNTAFLAIMAIVAVGFGGAVGPEAGILAVVAEMSLLISMLIARDHAEARLIGEIGAAGALGGIYGSPPGAAVIAQEHPEAPKLRLYLAALTGLLGFILTVRMFLPENPLHIHLPDHVPAGDGTDIIFAVLPAILGAGAGVFFLMILPLITSVLSRWEHIWVQTLVGTALFATLATAFPILRFSGHHELEEMLVWGQEFGMAALLGLAALKMLALALCLSSGWRGGAAFPLLFAGAAAGVAVVWLLPGTPVTVALVSGMAAAITAGMGKPIAAMLIALLLIGPVAIWPLCVGALVGWGASKLAPPQVLH